METVLKKYFGFSSLRPYQSEVVDQVLHGRDCLVVMATGAGKSLCYQLPPLVTNKTCIVVSPLLSLMQDQVMSLKHKGVKSDYLGSTQKNLDVTINAQNGCYHVLYMTPERAMALTNRFWSKLMCHGVCLLAVDEAHCISEWGHDFRIVYKRLHFLRQNLPGVPYLALTATATERVRSDITESLALHQPFIYIGSFDRPNLYYGVKLINGAGRTESFIKEIINDVYPRYTKGESTIIYCATIRDTEQVCEALISHGVIAGIYHGQMDSGARELSHKAFVTDEVLVMVATIAFGMGIDKPDVRCVIHYGCPKSLESYYQESGRCGRDGLPSVCLLYYQRSDFSRGDFYCAETKNIAQKTAIMNSFIAGQKYCMLGTCRRQNLLNYFGEDTLTFCGNCDNCISPIVQEKDFTKESILLLSCIRECGNRWGLNFPISVLRGSKARRIVSEKYHRLPIHGEGKEYSSSWWKALGSILIDHGYLDETVNGTYRVISLSDKGSMYLAGRTSDQYPLVFKLTPEMITEVDDTADWDDTQSDDVGVYDQTSLSNEETQVYQMLVEVRKKLADDNQVAPYTICGDQVLRSIAVLRPSNRENLALVDGVNLYFITMFSVIFLECIKEISQDLNIPLDNITLDETQYFTEESGIHGIEEEMTHEDIKEHILSLISPMEGVSVAYIVSNCTCNDEKAVLAALDELECDFEIYNKNGLYFPM